MPYARVVTFEGVGSDRIAQMKQEIEGGEKPAELPATEMMVLHNPDEEKSVAIVFFDTEDDYRKGDEFLGSMPRDNTPGQRTSVEKYDVAIRSTG